MHAFNFRLVFIVSALTFGIVADASAVPTVRKLGAGTSVSGSTTAVKASTSSGSTSSSLPSRASSVRAKGVSTVKSQVKTTSAKTTSASDSAARLSVGKYIHGAGVSTGVIQPVATTNTNVSSDEVLNLTDRISSLENSVESKQNSLTAGDGIVIENNKVSIDTNINKSSTGEIVKDIDYDNGVLTVTKGDITIPVGEYESITRAKIWIE